MQTIEEKKATKRRYYLRNKDKINKRKKQYYYKNRKEILQQQKEYYEKNKERAKQYRWKNREGLLKRLFHSIIGFRLILKTPLVYTWYENTFASCRLY